VPAVDRTKPANLAAVSKLSTVEVMELAAESARAMASQAGRIVLLLGELDRRQGWRVDGATSLEAWVIERFGFSVATARAYAHVAERLFDLPHLADGLSTGALSFDKVRAVVDTATPETDRDLRQHASTHSVVELSQLARASRSPGPSAAQAEAERDRRSLRFNDTFRTVTAQLPTETYTEVRVCLEAAAKRIPSDGETRWDQRLCDAFVGTIRSSGNGGGRARSAPPFTVVAHVPIDVLVDGTSELPGELERRGLIDAETVRRVACDATIVVAADDNAGHTMYEGRARRYPTDAQRREIVRRDRHCRFPGCHHVTFVNPHHIRWWTPHAGPTDLPNLVLLCEHHHHLVHSKPWSVSGDANDELSFLGPSGRVMTSRPSPLWTAVSATSRSEASGKPAPR
jgi:hypothetical protein